MTEAVAEPVGPDAPKKLLRLAHREAAGAAQPPPARRHGLDRWLVRLAISGGVLGLVAAGLTSVHG